jgi:hypothetical protein
MEIKPQRMRCAVHAQCASRRYNGKPDFYVTICFKKIFYQHVGKGENV